MAPSAISMDPVSQLESESAFIIEAAKMDVKSNPHYEVKPALVPITTELQYDGSTGPSSATDGFIDTPTNGLAVVEPSSATDGFTVVEPSSVVDGFTDAPAVGSTVIPSASEPEGFTDIPAAAPAAVDAPSETDGFVETQPEEAAAVEAAPAEAAAVEAAPVKAAPVEAAPIEAAPVEAAPVETAPVEAAPAVDDAMDVTPAAPAVVEEHPSVTEEVKETAPVELAVKEVSSATEPAAAAPPASLAVKEVPAAQSNKWLSLGQIIPSVQEPMSGAKKLRKMIFETNELIICPGVYDGLSARTAIEVGFNAMYMTGAGTTASRLGQPDLAIAQLHEMRENAEMIANLDPFGPPLIADMDTGYGGPIMAARTVEQYIRSGVAGAHLEDQVLMKRCGHLGGKRVVAADEYIARIRAAHAARVRLQSDFVLIARTDALQTLGYDECISRLRMARDEGADVGLLEGFSSKEQAAQAVKDLAPWPLLLNSVENGKSPLITVEEARQMGFRIMIFSFASIAPAYIAIRDTLTRLRDQGVVGTPKDITPVKLFEVCGLKHSMAVDMNAGGASFAGEL